MTRKQRRSVLMDGLRNNIIDTGVLYLPFISNILPE